MLKYYVKSNYRLVDVEVEVEVVEEKRE